MLQNGVFDNVNFDGNVSYTKEPDKYNKKDWWYRFQVHCALKAYKYPPFPTDYEKNWKPQKEGYLIRKRKRDDELTAIVPLGYFRERSPAIFCAPKYHKTRSIRYFGPLFLDN